MHKRWPFFMIMLWWGIVAAIEEPPFTSGSLFSQTKTVVVNCGEGAKSELISGSFDDPVNLLMHDDVKDAPGLYYAAPYYSNGLYHFHINHPVAVPALNDAEHNKPGHKGHLKKTCHYAINYVIYFTGGSDFDRILSLDHWESTAGSDPCEHHDEEP